jgi:hypothetical protein
MIEFVTFLNAILGSFPFVLLVLAISFCIKGFILYILIKNGLNTQSLPRRPWFFLLFALIGTMFSDLAWMTKLSHSLFFIDIDYRPILFLIRFSWAFCVVQYHALGLFLESLTEQQHVVQKHQKLLLPISGFFILYSFVIAFMRLDLAPDGVEFTMRTVQTLYLLFPVTLSSLFITLYKIRKGHIPLILQKQLKLVVKGFIAPYLIVDFLQMYPFNTSISLLTNYSVVSISTIVIAYGLYFCTQRIMGLRFLNFSSHVESLNKFNFVDNFKEILEQLSHVTNTQELKHMTQTFFKTAFGIPLTKTTLYIRKVNNVKELGEVPMVESIIEHFMRAHDTSVEVAEYLQKNKVLLYDEIAFSTFYDNNATSKSVLALLDNVNADIFLPIYEQQTMIGCIIVERHARSGEFYSNIERDEMLIFGGYLSALINLLQHRNIENFLHQEKETQAELYAKHQEMAHYKESIQTFVRSAKKHEEGIIFYKNRRFSIGNQAAKDLISIDLNAHEGHPLTQSLKQLARMVQEYKTLQTTFVRGVEGNFLVVYGIPSLTQNSVIITIGQPEISDILKKNIDLLKNPADWDYLLYLETTKSGHLINQLVPGSGESLLNYKISLLKVALSQKALFLAVPLEDIMQTAEVLHRISQREAFQVLTLHEPLREGTAALCGINPLFAPPSDELPLLKKLDSGTLFIQNIQFLDRDAQEHLAEYMMYGFYRMVKSDQKIPSGVRIICSSDRPLEILERDALIIKPLADQLKNVVGFLPFSVLTSAELGDLADGFVEQALMSQPFKNLLSLTDKDKTKLVNPLPKSLQEFKMKVQQLLVQKSKKNQVYEETVFDPAYAVSDPELIEAARLGKYALKDAKIMASLWHKFKNQNKIATFLGVNRSSINRRCKEYNLN